MRNEADTIEECINSVFNQSYKEPYEVIVVEGYSDDDTYTKLKNLQKTYPFQLYQNEIKNAAAGRNTGIKHAKADKVVFIDGDAVASHNWLEQITKVFKKHPKATGVGGPDLLPKNSEYKSKMIGYFMTSPLARGGKFNPSTQHSLMKEERHVDHIPTCNLCLKKSIFKKIGGFDEIFVKGQDLELNYRIKKHGGKLVYSPKIKVVHYRKQHFSTFARQIYKWAKAKIAVIRKHGFDGITSHIYLWPIYAIGIAATLFILSLLLHLFHLFILLLLLGTALYIILALNEAVNLMKKYQNKPLFFYALILFPIVHGAYAFGILTAFVRKKIW